MDLPGWLTDDWRRRFGLPAGVLLGTVLLGALIGSQLGIDGGSSSNRSAFSRLEGLPPGTLETLPGAVPERLDKPLTIGSRDAGVAVLAASHVDSVETKGGKRRAPDGGNLVVFELGNAGCETPPCKPWRALEPQVQIDGLVKDLPRSGSTFVVAVPAGTSELRLVVDDAGYRQSVSLGGDDYGSQNIVLLAREDPTKKLALDKAYRLTEQTDIKFREADGGLVDRFTRNATVDYAQRRFFLGEERPSTPRRAFLIVSASYSYPGKTQRYAFSPTEITFEDSAGKSYPERGEPIGGSALLSFEIPGSVTRGTLVFGGTSAKNAANGVPYTSTLSELRVPIEFD